MFYDFYSGIYRAKILLCEFYTRDVTKPFRNAIFKAWIQSGYIPYRIGAFSHRYKKLSGECSLVNFIIRKRAQVSVPDKQAYFITALFSWAVYISNTETPKRILYEFSSESIFVLRKTTFVPAYLLMLYFCEFCHVEAYSINIYLCHCIISE